MATSEEVFISISPELYRKNKSAVLVNQTYLLMSLKHLQNLKVISRQKQELRKKFYKLLSTTLSNIVTLQSRMPTSDIPEIIQKHEHALPRTKSEAKTKTKKIFSKKAQIDEELKLIQEKLKELNS